jgi:Peroxidase
MRFEPEALHGANAGLNIARQLMEKVKQEFPWITYGDLWTLAGVAAIQVFPFLMYCCYVLFLLFSYRKWLAPRFPGARVALTVSLPTLHQMDVSPMLLRAQTTLEVSLTVWGT